MIEKLILDPCCGAKMMWFDKNNPGAVFGDCWIESMTVKDRSHGNEQGTRSIVISPDKLMDFRSIPYPDNSFYSMG